MNTRLHCWTPAAILVIAGSTQSLAAGPFGPLFEVSSLNGTNGFVINGIDESDQSGFSVSSAGDINNDGVADVLIGARSADPNGQIFAGESYVVFGGASVGAGGSFDLASLNGPNGFVINGVSFADSSGHATSSAGDINGDGFDDLIIGASYSLSNNRTGNAYVVFGGPGAGTTGTIELSALSGSDGFAMHGIATGDFFGFSVSAAGDVNGDGVDDLIVGANFADPNGDKSGECYVIFGAAGIGAGGSFDLTTLNGANGFVLSGLAASDNCGYSVCSAEDINGDGLDDLIIAARLASPNGNVFAGECYLVFGTVGIGVGGAFDLSSLNGTNGFVIHGIDPDDRIGDSVCSAGDFNDDGFDDVMVGARFAAPNGMSKTGETYVIFGSAAVGAGGSLELSSLNGVNGLVYIGAASNDQSGSSVSSAGDVNGDGVVDLIIGAYDSGFGSSDNHHVVFGHNGAFPASFDLSTLDGTDGFTIHGADLGDKHGKTVSCAGDVNDDGYDDLITSGPFADPSRIVSAGESYVIFGRSACPTDINADGVIDTADLGILIGQFGTPGPTADINYDGVVDTADLGILIAAFGTPCP